MSILSSSVISSSDKPDHEETLLRHLPRQRPDVGMEMCRCVSCAMAIARPTNDISRGSTPPPPLETRYLCTKWHRPSWNSRAFTAIPETSGQRAVIHKSRGTIHGGKNFAICPIATYCEPPCLSGKCPRQSLTEPFQTVHHSTGHGHNSSNSK